MTTYIFSGLSIITDAGGNVTSSQNTAISIATTNNKGSLTANSDGSVSTSGVVSASMVGSTLMWNTVAIRVDLGQMMSGTATGLPILHDVPHFPSTKLGLLTRIETHPGILDIPDIPGAQEIILNSPTGTSIFFDLPEPPGFTGKNQFSMVQQVEADMDTLLNNALANVQQVDWTDGGVMKSATVLVVPDPDTGAQHIFGLKGDTLPKFTSKAQAQSWLDSAQFTASAELPGAAKGILLQFDEVDAVFQTANDMLAGTDLGEVIRAGGGNDVVYALKGDDTVFGGNGNDGVNGGNGNDTIKGGRGHDVLVGGNGADWVSGQSGNDFISGENDSDHLFGGRGHDVLDGGNGKDFIFGGAGNDLIFGGKGNDVLTGGKGADVFVFEANAKGGSNLIKDFTVGEDKIQITEVVGMVEIVKEQIGANTRVTFNDTSILMHNVDANALTNASFDFAPPPGDGLF